MLLAIVMTLAMAGSGTGGQWYVHYATGVELIGEGRADEAYDRLTMALAQRAEPRLRVRTYGVRYIDYTPHLYLAVAAQMMGNVEPAREHLAAAEKAGVAAQSSAGSKLLAAYQILLWPAITVPTTVPTTAAAQAPTNDQGYKVFERRDEVLTEVAFQDLRNDVAERCGLPPDSDSSAAPWYFHYEMGLELASHGDAQRALDALIVAADRRPTSERNLRMYGMWFTDYLPYFGIARVHAQLGNWECAADALVMSGEMGEISENDEQYGTLCKLREEVEAKVDP